MLISHFKRFMAWELAGGVMLFFAAVAALIISNSAWAPAYNQFIQMPGEVRFGDWLVLKKPMVVWINDLWMAVFFLLVGLEIKREMLDGELASVRKALLPAAAALGGMAVPALIYSAFNAGDAIALRGWAIPAATDIAFALGILMLLGSRVPLSLKIFLTAVAIIDDLGAIVVIALFYTEQLSLTMLGLAGLGVAVLVFLNRSRVMAISPYIVVGLLVWLFVLKSGVHATLAGVVTAFAIPLRNTDGLDDESPLTTTEHALHPWVAFMILPTFAFANAGVSLEGVSVNALFLPIPLGIAAGLLVGKTVGIYLATFLMVKLAGASWPSGATQRQFVAMCILCGIGFTMSLFIGGLAFQGQDPAYITQLKIGVLGGSLVSALVGVAVMWKRPAGQTV